MDRSPQLSGVLVLDKPAGMTSADAVAEVKRLTRARKVGHTGTLDPMATGVLPLCLGKATKLAGYLLAEDKEYDGEILLGVETDTLDAEGQTTAEDPEEARRVGEAALREAMAAFVGRIEQVPPMYSALKQEGRRLHELARQGVDVRREPRLVEVERFDLVAFDPPRVRFAVACSKGTYVRSLARDLGRRLGCGAHLSALRRVRAGAFRLEQATRLEEIREGRAEERLIPPARALAHLPAAEVPERLLGAVSNGKPLPWSALGAAEPAPEGLLRLLSPGGALVALARVGAGGRLRYERVLQIPLT